MYFSQFPVALGVQSVNKLLFFTRTGKFCLDFPDFDPYFFKFSPDLSKIYT